MPKSAVADSATITRLCAFLPRRSLINISVLRHHGGFRRDDHPVSGGIADHRNPRLEEKGDLDLDQPAPRGADTRAVPYVARVRLGRRCRAVVADGLPGAGVGLERKTASEFALHRRGAC